MSCGHSAETGRSRQYLGEAIDGQALITHPSRRNPQAPAVEKRETRGAVAPASPETRRH